MTIEKMIKIGLALCMIAVTFVGCGSSQNEVATLSDSNAKSSPIIDEPEADEDDIIDYSCYDELIEEVTEGLKNGFTEEQQLSLDVTSCFFYTDPSYEIMGYLIEDIDADGVKELLFGVNSDTDWDSIIYDVYTIKDGEMVHTVKGWERNRYYLCEDGMLANEGSSSAFLSIYAYYNYYGQIIESESNEGLVESVIIDAFRDENNPYFYSKNKPYDEDGEPITEQKANEIIDSHKHQKIVFNSFI